MKRLLVILILVVGLSDAFSAITERYVNNAGSGSADGTSEANAMSFATFTDYMSTGGSFTAAAGDRFNIKGTITSRTTTADVWINVGTITSPIIIRGYNSTIGDLTSLARTNGNGPLVTTNYPSITYTTGGITISGNFIIVEALNITSANVGSGVGTVKLNGTDLYMKRCSITNSGTNANSTGVTLAAARDAVIDCDVSLTGASGGTAAIAISSATVTSRVIGCRVKGGPSVGISASGTSVIAKNTIYASTGIGVSLSGGSSNSCVVLDNTIVGGGADGINLLTGTTATQILIGNIITDNTGDGIDMVSTANAAYASNNRTRDNATAYNNAGDWLTATKYNDVTTDTGGPETDYVNSAGNDYNLIWGSPARGAGNPLYADIGALQAPTPTPTPTPTSTPCAGEVSYNAAQ